MQNFSEKSIIIFDLDGTLATSKMPMDKEMAQLFYKLLEKKFVAIISGGSFLQFEKQLLSSIQYSQSNSAIFSNLYLLPASGSSMYNFKDKTWIKEYSYDFSSEEKTKIYTAFNQALIKSDETMPIKLYGEQFEDRGSQITFSALGQQAPVRAKESWDPDQKRRTKIVAELKILLPEFSIGIGGMTSIDITKKGIDKAFGILELSKYTKIPIKNMLYVGDALYPGGNDYAAYSSGIECYKVKDVSQTKKLIESII